MWQRSPLFVNRSKEALNIGSACDSVYTHQSLALGRVASVVTMPRNTRTGPQYQRLIERYVRAVAQKKNFRVERDKRISLPGGMSVKIPFVLISEKDDDCRYLVDTMVMNTSGSAQLKATNTMVQMLRITLADPRYKAGFLVRGGGSWTRSYVDFLTEDFAVHVPRARDRIFTVNSDEFTKLMLKLL